MKDIEPLNKNVFFGHQSVGSNILDGVRSISPQSIEKIHEVYIGRNRDSLSKLNGFDYSLSLLIDSGHKVDIAMMKFCYVDIPDSNLTTQQVFNEYTSIIDQLKQKYPEVIFVHVTVPLTSKPTGLKNQAKLLLKSVLGRPRYNPDLNIDRELYNNMLRVTFTNDPIFDIAAIESSNGKYQENGIPALTPAYTYDGGHLNERGQRIVAEKLLEFLNTL